MAKILVTAGPTREHLDDVRYLSNGSSGRMGYAIAAAASAAGCPVTLVSGPTGLPTPAGVERIDVVSAREMHDRARAAFADCDIAFGVAAVCDHRPARRAIGKPAKPAGPYALELVPNPDVVAMLGAEKGRRVVVGFALERDAPAELEAAIQRARDKLAAKRLDLIVLNRTSAIAADDIDAVLLDAAGRREDLPRMPKDELAARLVARALEERAKRSDGAE